MSNEKKTTTTDLRDLIEISHHYGSKKEYVIAGGGNTSFKTNDKIWIKASGTSLAEMDNDSFVCLSRMDLKKISTKSYSRNPTLREPQVKEDLHRAIVEPGNKRPSVETSLHEIIDFPYVVHTHPTLVNALMCSKRAKRLSKKIFGRQVIFVEYTDPGYVLFKKVEEEILQYRLVHQKEPAVIFLQNHGVFVSGNSPDEIKEIYTDIENKLKSHITSELPDNKTHPSLEYGKRLSKDVAAQLGIDPSFVLFRNNAIIQHFIQSGKDFERVDKPLTPDDIVYCKSNYLYTTSDITDIKADVDSFTKRFGHLPKIIAIKDKGLISIDSSEKSALTVMDVFENMMKVSFFSGNFGGTQALNPEQIDFIDNWEVENYRRQLR